MTQTAVDRFWARVSKPADDDCWIWTGLLGARGYGRLTFRGVHTYAHRLAYELSVGAVPEGMTLDHLCRKPACCNPAHLEPVTRAENTSRAATAITHCPAGHPYDEANTRIVKGGHRQCRTCDRERTRASRNYGGLVYGGTHCRNGHEYTPENTRINGAGSRVCRACVRDQQRRHRAPA